MCGQRGTTRAITLRGDIPISLAPVTSNTRVGGLLALGRNALLLLPIDSGRASRLPDPLGGLGLQITNELVDHRLGNGSGDTKDRDPCFQQALRGDPTKEIRHRPSGFQESIGSRLAKMHSKGSTDGGNTADMILIRRVAPSHRL